MENNIIHLVAAEKYYQVFTFEGRSFNEEESAEWQLALDLGDEANRKVVIFVFDNCNYPI